MPSPKQPPPGDRPRRRWLFRPIRRLRPLRHLFLLLLVLLALAYWAVESGRLDRLVATRLLRTATAAGYELSFSSMKLEAVPPSLRLTDVSLREAGGDPAAPLFTVDRLEVVLAIRSLLRGTPRIGRAELHRPVFRWPQAAAREGPPAAIPDIHVFLRRLQVTDGTILLPEGALPVSGEATGLSIQGLADTGGLSLHVLVDALRLRLPGTAGVWEGKAEGNAVLGRRQLRVERLRWVSQDLSLEASGTASLAGELDLTFRGTAEAEPLAALGAPVPVAGTVGFEGEVHRGGEGLPDVTAAFEARELQVDAEPVREIDGNLTWRDGELRLEAAGDLLGGRAALRYELRPHGDAPTEHDLSVRPEGLDLRRALAVMGFSDLPWNTRVAGEAHASWLGRNAGSLRASAELILRAGLSEPGKRAYALHGTLSLAIEGEELRIRSADVRGEGFAVRATGRARMGEGEVALRLESRRPAALAEGYLQPILDRVIPGTALPGLGPLQGEIRLEGRVALAEDGPHADGLLRADGLTWDDIPLGDLTARIVADREIVRLRDAALTGEGGRLEADGEVWIAGAVPGRGEVRLRLEGVPLDDWVRRLTGRPSPIDGLARGVGRVVHHGCGTEGRFSLSMEKALLFGAEAGPVRGELALKRDVVQLVEVEARYGGGMLRASGELHVRDAPAVDLGFAATGLSVSELRGEEVLPFLAGSLDLDGTVNGPLESPEIAARLAYHGPPGVAADLGEAELRVQGTAEELRLEGSSPRHRLTLLGTAGLGSGLPVSLNLRAEQLDLALLGSALRLPLPVELHGEATLQAAVFGPLEDPSRMRAEARVTELRLDAGGYELRNDGSVSFGWSEGVAVLRPSRLVGDGTDLVLRGRSHGASGGLESEVEGDFDLRLLAALDPRLRLTGMGHAAVKVDVREGAPGYSGRVSIAGARLGYEGFPATIDGLQGAAEFVGPELTVQSLSGRLGGGSVRGTGYVRFDGLRPQEVHLELYGERARVVYPEDLESVADFSLLVEDHARGYRISGDVDVLRGIYRLPLDTSDALLPAQSRAGIPLPAEIVPAAGEGSEILLDVSLNAPDALFLRSRDVNVEAGGDLRFAGTLSSPRITGRIDALEGGVIRFRDVRYRVIGGFVDFAEYGSVDPFFHIEASTTVRDYEVILVLDGRLSDFTFELTSYPPLEQEEILVLLLTGNTPDEVAAKGGTALVSEQVASALSAPISGNVAQALGLTQVRVEPVDVNGNARLTLVKEVNPGLRVTYSDTFQAAGKQIYRVEYDVTRKTELLAVRNEDGGVGGDFRYTTRGYSYPRPASEREGKQRVGTIELIGAPPELEERLRKRIRAKEGRAYRRSAEVDSVDRLRATLVRNGYLDATVDVEESTAGDRVNLRFEVESGTPYQLVLPRGLPAERKLRKRLAQSFRTMLIPGEAPAEGRRTIEQFYLNRGYPRVTVEEHLEEGEGQRQVLRFEVDPGPKVHVTELRFEGNESFSGERLRKLLMTREGTGSRRSLLRMDRLEEDVDALRLFYRTQGYADVRVAAPRIDYDAAGDLATVSFPITEGPQWLIGQIVFDGNAAFSDEELQEQIQLAPGEPITRAALEAARTAIRLHYDEAGYEAARVAYAIEGEAAEARLIRFRIEEGVPRRVGSIEVAGNSHTRDRVIWRELGVDEGDPLSRDQLLAAQRRLGRLGIFRSVDVSADAAGDGAEVPVAVRVREAPNILTSFGGGWDTEAGLRGFFQIRDNNFLGRGQTLGAALSASGITQRVRFSFLEPRLFGREVEGLLTASWSMQDQISFDQRTVALTAAGTRRIGPYRFITAYTIEDVTLSDVQVLLLEDRIEDVRLGSVSGTMIRDRRDDPFNPRRGLYYSLDLTLFDRYLGSERDFLSFFGHVSYFHPVTDRSYWAQGFRVGLQEPFGRSVIPISERFFAGGDSTIRGFPRDTVGPKDPGTGSPLGGNALLILNEEYHFPIWRDLEGVGFLDLGNVYPGVEDLSLTDVRKVLGFGLHYRTPLGPIRLEYGHKLDRRPGESSGELYFSIGLAF
ncbi:MAG: outer membrane protein assembly factor BamA [Acidobacteriota bacterium]|jgi:outer membrane protein assembly complex protein YaeT